MLINKKNIKISAIYIISWYNNNKLLLIIIYAKKNYMYLLFIIKKKNLFVLCTKQMLGSITLKVAIIAVHAQCLVVTGIRHTGVLSFQ